MRKKLLTIIIIFIIVVLLGSTKYFFLRENEIYAMNVEEALSLIGENNFINKVLRQEIKKNEEKKAKEIVRRAREEKKAKAERVEAERLRKIEEEKNSQIKINKVKVPNIDSSKVAYLTFDDGPSTKSTPLILDILDEYNVKATFFVLGSMAKKNPDMLKRIYDEGHKIGNHSYSHNYKYIYENADNFLKDFKRAEDIFEEILGEEFSTNTIRFPGGSFGKHKEAMVVAAQEAGYNYYDWNSLNGDAESIKLNKSYLLRRLKETVGNKKKVTILMHDTDTKIETVETLRASIDYLIQKGFRFEVLN